MAKGKRQVLDEAPIDGLTFGKPKRDRSWDAAHNYMVTSYRLPPETQQTVKDIAATLGVSPADVAAVFLDHAIQEYQAGRLRLDPKPKSYTLR